MKSGVRWDGAGGGGEGGYTPSVSARRLSLGLHYKTRLCVYVLEAKTCK